MKKIGAAEEVASEEEEVGEEVAPEEQEVAAIGGGGGGEEDLLKEAPAEEEGGEGVDCIQEYATTEGQQGFNFLGTLEVGGLVGTCILLGNEESMNQNVFSKSTLGPDSNEDAVLLELGWKVLIGSTWYAYCFCYENMRDNSVRYNNNKKQR
jgi:hypothetical protein